MNDSTTILHRVRLIADAKVKTFGERNITEFPVALNTYGGKAKERYVESYIFNVSVGGPQAARLADLKKGDQVSVIGTVEEREYKGKMYKDIPFAEKVIILKSAAQDAQRTEADAEDSGGTTKAAKPPVNTKGTDANPFANNDLPF